MLAHVVSWGGTMDEKRSDGANKIAAQMDADDTRLRVMVHSPNIQRIISISSRLRDPDLAYRILDELPDGIILVDHKGIIQLVNKQTEALFGYTRFELDGAPLSVLVPIQSQSNHKKQMADYFANPTKRPMSPAVMDRLKLFGIRKDGTEVLLDISLTPISSPQEVFVLAVTRARL